IVVFPAPFGPMIVRSSPFSTTSDRSFKALKPSKLTVTPLRYKSASLVDAAVLTPALRQESGPLRWAEGGPDAASTPQDHAGRQASSPQTTRRERTARSPEPHRSAKFWRG